MINRLSHSRLGNISFIALVAKSYLNPRSLRSLVTKYDIVSRAIKLISPRLSYTITYTYKIVVHTVVFVGDITPPGCKRLKMAYVPD